MDPDYFTWLNMIWSRKLRPNENLVPRVFFVMKTRIEDLVLLTFRTLKNFQLPISNEASKTTLVLCAGAGGTDPEF
jgi:hypothetical protein